LKILLQKKYVAAQNNFGSSMLAAWHIPNRTRIGGSTYFLENTRAGSTGVIGEQITGNACPRQDVSLQFILMTGDSGTSRLALPSDKCRDMD
jgi:hypothetical protein